MMNRPLSLHEQNISEALRGNKNAEGTRRVGLKKPIRNKALEVRMGLLGFQKEGNFWRRRDDGKLFNVKGTNFKEVKEEAEEQKPTLRVVKQKKTAKPKKPKEGIVEQMLQDYDFGEDKGSHDFHSFKQKYGSQFSEQDLKHVVESAIRRQFGYAAS